MLKIVFKNLNPSQITREIVQEKIEPVLKRYPLLLDHEVTLTLEMENSPFKAGRDFYTVSTMVKGKTFKNLRIKKSSDNFYIATADLVDRLNELLSCESYRLNKNKQKTKISSGAIYA